MSDGSVLFVNPTALAGCARKVEREWGSVGYSMRVEGVHRGGCVCAVRHNDGSRFYVWSTRWENEGHADTFGDAYAALKAETEREREALKG